MNPLATTSTATLAAPAPIGGGETATFWVLGTIIVLGALGVVFFRKAVHSALSMALTMIGLAIFYGINEAPFLMVVQVVVYTGAVLMLFLFVLMLVGVSASDSLVETISGQRFMTAVVALAFIGALITGISRIVVGDPTGIAAGAAAAGGSVPWIAGELLMRYLVAFEATAALLITAVLGAMVMAHTARTKKRRTQREMSEDRIRGDHPTPLPGPGTYARHNAIDMPALLPDGSVSRLSLNPVLLARDPEYQSKVPEDVRASSPLLPGDASQAVRTEEGHAIEGEGGNLTGSENGKAKTPGDGEHDENGNGKEVESSWTR